MNKIMITYEQRKKILSEYGHYTLGGMIDSGAMPEISDARGCPLKQDGSECFYVLTLKDGQDRAKFILKYL